MSARIRHQIKYRRSDDGRYWVTRVWWNIAIGHWQSRRQRRELEREYRA